MANVTEAKAKFVEAKKALDDGIAKKAKLEERLAELQSKLSEFSITDIKKERQKVCVAVALGAISDNEYKKLIEKLGRVETEHAGLTAQLDALNEAMSDTDSALSNSRQDFNEASRCLYLSIAEKLTEQIKQKMPTRDLQLLAVCKFRSGLVWGRDGWRNTMDELTGSGRFDASATQKIESDLKKQYGF